MARLDPNMRARQQCTTRLHPQARCATPALYSHQQRAFTLIELLLVIVLLGIFIATLLPRFVDLSEDTRNAHAQSVSAAFATALSSYRAAWLAEGRPETLDLQGKLVTFETTGWPHPAAVSTAICLDLWDTAFHGAQPIEAYVPGAPSDDWTAIGIGTSCAYVFQNGGVLATSSLRPIFFYRPVNGTVTIQRFFM